MQGELLFPFMILHVYEKYGNTDCGGFKEGVQN